jgi:hypothetical protein
LLPHIDAEASAERTRITHNQFFPEQLNVLSTENELQHALSALAETSLQQTEARIGLNIALGGGLIADNEAMTVTMIR